VNSSIEASKLRASAWSLLRRVPKEWPFSARRWARGLGRRAIGKLYVQAPFYEGKLLVQPFDEVGSCIEEHGFLEAAISEVARDAARRSFDYVDVGANIGVHLCAFGLAAQRASRGRWHAIAFEPAPSIFPVLVANCRLNGLTEVHCRNTGLSDVEGTARLFLSDTSNKGNNTFVDNDVGRETVVCRLSTLDREAALVGLTRVFIKIDAEGYEKRVLLGGRNWIRALSDAVVVLEIFPSLLKEAGGSAREIGELLRSLGFAGPLLVRDSGTIRDDGSRSGTVYNLLYTKGAAAEEAASEWMRKKWLLDEGAAGWLFENE
jgi:FkbM family methyltransferase